MEKRVSFIFYRSFYDALTLLEPEERLDLFRFCFLSCKSLIFFFLFCYCFIRLSKAIPPGYIKIVTGFLRQNLRFFRPSSLLIHGIDRQKEANTEGGHRAVH